MDRNQVLTILKEYGISDFNEKREIDSSLDDDYRLNIIIDKKYVLRINNEVMTEERLASIDRLASRYRAIGVAAPRLVRSIDEQFSVPFENHVCYVSEYLDYPTFREKETELDAERISHEVWKSIGKLSKNYSDVDLSPVNSMWSIIDLAPLDEGIDEKQENLNLLVSELEKIGEEKIAKEVVQFNEAKRAKIKKVYDQLPRCVIQGDLNGSNILVDDGHFVGLIDFNMAGTEVNVNHFVCETNEKISTSEFETKNADALYSGWVKRQQEALNVILTEYTLNDLEKSVIGDYRSICRISMYPNVMDYLSYLEKYKNKMIEVLKLILAE